MILFSFSLQFLIFFNILLLLSIILTFFYQKDKNKGFSYPEIKQDFLLYCKYIDKFYINNMYFTVLAVFVYIFTNFILFFILRFVALGQMTTVMKLSTLHASLWNVNNVAYFGGLLFFFLSGSLLFKYLTTLLLYEEVIKFRIYLSQVSFFRRIKEILTSNPVENTLKFLAFISYRISNGTYDSEMFKGDFDSWYNLQLQSAEEDTLRHLYENIHIKILAEYFMFYAKKYKLISKIFYMMAYMFNFLRYLCHGRFSIKGFYSYFIYTFFIIIFIIDMYNRNFFYVYYANFIYFFLLLHQRYCKFEESLDSSSIYDFAIYFYNNEKPYYLQRVDILNNIHNIKFFTKQNNNIYVGYSLAIKDKKLYGVVYSALNQMKTEPFTYSETTLLEHKKRHNAFIRAHIIILFFILGIFLIFFQNMFIIKICGMTISNYIIFFPIIIMMLCAKGAYTLPIGNTFTLDEYWEPSRGNPYYNAIFWVISSFQGYLYWLLIVKSEIFMLHNETLLTLSFILKLPEEILFTMPYENIKQLPEALINYNLITIKKIYSLEEKIQYLYEYFEHYLYIFNMELLINDELLRRLLLGVSIDIDYLRHMLRQIDFKLFLDKETTLKDIQVYINLFIENSIWLELYHDYIMEKMTEIMEKAFLDNQNYLHIKSFLNTISTVASVIIALDVFKFHVLIIELIIKPTSLATGLFAHSVLKTIIEIISHYRR